VKPTQEPTTNPTVIPSASPTTSPTEEPTPLSVAPTAGPTYWDGFGLGNATDTSDDNYVNEGADGSRLIAAGAAAGGLSVLAIIAIIVAALVATIVILVVLTGGTGLLVWKRRAMNLDDHSADFEGELVEMNAVPMGRVTLTTRNDEWTDTVAASNPMTMKKMSSWSKGV
jgi:hypothetical protein